MKGWEVLDYLRQLDPHVSLFQEPSGAFRLDTKIEYLDVGYTGASWKCVNSLVSFGESGLLQTVHDSLLLGTSLVRTGRWLRRKYVCFCRIHGRWEEEREWRRHPVELSEYARQQEMKT